MKIQISPIQVQKQVLAPHMQQSIEVLLLPLTELHAAIEEELQNNPLLEIDEDKTKNEQSIIDEIISNRLKLYDEFRGSPSYHDNQDDDQDDKTMDRLFTRSAPLEDSLLQQLRIEITDPLELTIGEFIIGNLDEDGYLTSSLEEIAQLLDLRDKALIEQVLTVIQIFEPLGIASRNLKECLLIQVHYKLNGESELLAQMINDHLHDLGRKKYAEIARRLKTPIEKIKKAALTIGTLEPKPARNYRPVESNIYIKPDITVTQDDQEQFHIRINRENIPNLRVSKIYKDILTQPNRSKEEVEFVQEKMKNAILFMKSIEQRNQTMRDIAEFIVNSQKDFFQEGHLSIKPMILKDVAQAIGRNESTVCRAINNKYMDTPQGTYPLKFFFSQAVSRNPQGLVSSRSIKEEIKIVIKSENAHKPLSDQEIYQHLSNKGMRVARRTVSKYRQTLKILPSHLRKV